jgi:hypothetical protein
MLPQPKFATLLFVALLLPAAWIHANVSRFIIDSRKLIVTKGETDKDIPYEVLYGHFEGTLNPVDLHNRIITDLAFAPCNADGSVGYSSNFTIVKPVDMNQATGVLYDMIPNRGHGEILQPDPYGHVHVVVGWQADIIPQTGLYTAQAPIAHQKDGSQLTGPVFVRFVNMPDGTRTLPIHPGIYPGTRQPTPVSLDPSKARLFYQLSDDSPQVDIPASEWAFADCASTPFPGKPDPSKLSLKGGFSEKQCYGLVYTGKDPLVLGIGLAATRDLISFLRYKLADAVGTANPLAGQIKWAITTGTSQSGNYIRTFIHLGFNADENGRIVFDGANPNIAARLVPLNVRFGVPGGIADAYQLGSEGVVWWGPYTDLMRGRKKASLLDRCLESGTCPKIIETFGSSEIWNVHMSPDLVGTHAKADIPLPPNVRRYYFPGVTHGGAPEDATEGFTLRTIYNKSIPCELPDNPNPSAPLLRAAIVNLIDWVKDGIEPPPSVFPTLSHGDLVNPNKVAMGFPALPGGFIPDGKINPFLQQDVGEGFDYADLSGAPSFMPPRCIRELPSLVPRVDADGNEIAGLKTVLGRVPLGTYTGWNAHASGYYKGRYGQLLGGFIPFAVTKAERLVNHDPRLSLEERYGTHVAYVARVRAAAAAMVAQHYLLPTDAAKIIEAAENSDILRE